MKNTDLAEEFTRLLTALLSGGYILARRNPRSGMLEPVTPVKLLDVETGHLEVDLDAASKIEDNAELSIANAYRFGVLQGPSYTAVRMRMMRSRELYPDITPDFRRHGAQSMYRVGDLRRWVVEYDSRNKKGLHNKVGQLPPSAPQPQLDGLSMLMGKIKANDKGEEDVRQEEDYGYDPEAADAG